MRFKCSMCSNIFESATLPTSCPACAGQGKARYSKKHMPAKRLTHKQRRQIAALDPELVKAFRLAQAQHPEAAGRVRVKVAPDVQWPEGRSMGKTLPRDDVRPDTVSPECLVLGECAIKI